MNKYIQRILIIALLVPFSVFAKTELAEKTTTGYGSTYQEALASALMDAVRQVRGLQVGSEKQLKSDFNLINTDKSDLLTAKVGVVEDIFTRSKGWVKSYSVKSVKKPKDKSDVWTVTLVAKIPEHKSVMKDDNRLSIAVMPFRFSHATYSVNDLGKASNTYQMSGRIRDSLQTSFTQTQQFAVVNRSFGNEFASEKALLSSDNVPAEEASRLGNIVGADFMVVGNIYDLSTKIEEKTFYGMTKKKILDRIDLSYQLIEVATQKVMWADTITEEVERPDKEYELSMKDPEAGNSTLDVISKLILSGVMDVLYPVKVLDVVSEEEIYLNQGQSRIEEGDVYAIFSKGRSLTDPDTGVEIKVEGKKQGELTVETVMAKYSVAALTDGKFKKVKKGVIVRLIKAESERHPSFDKEVRETPGSGEAPIKW